MCEKLKHLVAVHVMGWKLEENVLNFDEDAAVNAYVINGETDQLKKVYKYEKDFNPSVNLEDAWMVVEKLREKNLKVYVETEFHYYDVYVKNGLGGYVTECYTEESLPKAICLAALEALQVEVEEHV